MQQINIQHYQTSYGELMLGSYENQLCLCDWKNRKSRTAIDNRLLKNLSAKFVEKTDHILMETQKQLDEYFNHQRRTFDVPLLTIGTNFQKSVWSSLLKIPYAKVSNYLQLAEDISNKKAVRAVANANAANAISIIIPCHRIIGSNGKLVGYAGGLTAKESLLKLEGIAF